VNMHLRFIEQSKRMAFLLLAAVVWIASGCGTEQASPAPQDDGGRGVLGDEADYLLHIAIDPNDLAYLLANGYRVALAKNATADSPSYPLIWASFAPQAQNTVAWDGAYGVFAATNPPQPGAGLNVFASTAAEPAVLYSFGNVSGGCGFIASGTAGQTPDQYVIQYGNFCQQPRQALTLGLAQAVSVNGGSMVPNTLLAASALFQQTLTITKTESVQVFVLPVSAAASGTVLGSLPTGSLPVLFDELNTTRSIRYDAESHAFVADDPPPVISYGSRSYTFTKGVSVQPVVPSNTGGEMLTWSVVPALPAGLSLNSVTGIIAGTPAAVKPLAPYTVVATNTGGASVAVLSIAVNDLRPLISYPNSVLTFSPGTAIQPLVPTNSGGTVLNWSVRPALPPGLVFSTATGILSGTPSAVSPASHYTVTASNTGGSAAADLLITVRPPSPVITSQPASQQVAAGASAVFGVMASGTGPLSYQWLRNGAPIAGAISASWTTTPAVLADSGAVFSVVVSDAYGGSVTRAGATLAVSNAPRFASVAGPSGVQSYRIDGASGRPDTQADRVWQYRAGTDGSLAPMASPEVDAGTGPQAITVEPSGRYAYVANSGSDDVSQYAIGPDGGLSPLSTAVVAAGSGPQAISVDPSGRYVYVANSGSDDLYQYAIGPDGSLMAMAARTVRCGGAPRAVVTHPGGRYAYAANSGSGSLSQYSAGTDGSLSPMAVATVAAGSGPQSIAIDPSGTYLYAANEADSTVSQYSIRPDGSLAPLSPAALGTAPSPLAMATSPGGSGVTPVSRAYVAGSGDNSVSQYAIGADGSLSPLSTPAVAAGRAPNCVAVEPSNRYAYAPNWSGNSVSQYAIGADGSLSPLSTPAVAAGRAPTFVAIGPWGDHAYVTNQISQTVSQYAIGADGSLSPLATPEVPCDAGPNWIAVDPWGRYAYVANYNGADVSQYTIGADGSLTPMTPPTVACSGYPSSVAVDLSGRFAYVVSPGGHNASVVAQYAIGATGCLSPLAAAPTVPAGSSPWAIAVDPSGRYAYVTDFGGSAVLQYAIGANGALVPLSVPTLPAGRYPQGAAVDPSGRVLYVANGGDNSVSQYSIGAGGLLAPMSPPTVGGGSVPCSVATVGFWR